jgi:ubiquinone/menaquinone biosynthesis C-methylase UbiE
MTVEQNVAQHYTHGALEATILEALRKSGKDPERLEPDDLATGDEAHIGGREATLALAEQLPLRPELRLLDVGSGIGGPARYFAHHQKCHVTGIDLTDEFVRVARNLSQRVGLADKVAFVQGSALEPPFPAGSFDGAYMLHVGMNIGDKATLFAQVKRLLKPDGFFGIYDVMRTGPGEIIFPVPWAATGATSFVDDDATYRRLLTEAGFKVVNERERRAFALEFYARTKARIAETGLPPLGTHIVMGAEFQQKIANVVDALERGVIAPVEMIARTV